MGKVAMLSGRLATERALKTLHPKFARRCSVLYENLAALHEAGRLKYRFEIFEGFRHLGRQNALVAEGVSKAVAWHSAQISAWRLTSFRTSRPKKARCWDAHPVGIGRKLAMKLGRYSRSKRRSQA